jgi:hypothetical protein
VAGKTDYCLIMLQQGVVKVGFLGISSNLSQEYSSL